jgi:hypothetical protein
MMAKKDKVRVRISPGLRGLDAAWVSKTVLVTKSWTEVSPTLAKSLVGLERKGRPKFEFENDVADNAASETSDQAATEDE